MKIKQTIRAFSLDQVSARNWNFVSSFDINLKTLVTQLMRGLNLINHSIVRQDDLSHSFELRIFDRSVAKTISIPHRCRVVTGTRL